MQSSTLTGVSTRQARCTSFSAVAAAAFLLLASSRVSEAAVPESKATKGAQFTIQADGDVAEALAQDGYYTQKLVRAEIGGSHSEAALAEAVSQHELQRVNCSARDMDAITSSFCAILDGSNWQVAGKLESMVKKMHSLVSKEAQEHSLTERLQASLWQLWFCAKRIAPKCFPENSTEQEYQMARDNAWSALAELQQRAEVVPTTTNPRQISIPAVHNLEFSQRPLLTTEGPMPIWTSQTNSKAFHFDYLLKRFNLSTRSGASTLHVTNKTEAAIATLNQIIGPPRAQEKIMDAITDALRSDSIKKGEIAITDDADGNMKKFKDNMMTLHECASMPECATLDDQNCCTPSRPKQHRFIQARNQALEAWGNLDEDLREDNQKALEMLKLIAHTTTYYPFGHPLHVPTPASDATRETVTEKEENVEEEVVHEDSGTRWLLIAICAATGMVFLGVLILVLMSFGGRKKAEYTGGEEWYGEEGYGEEQW